MPSTRSSAATKCISEVPGLVKQTLTPPATSVRTRLSAPFIVPTPLVFLSRGQINHCSGPQSKGRHGKPAIIVKQSRVLTALTAKGRDHTRFACTRAVDMASLTGDGIFGGKKMTRV